MVQRSSLGGASPDLAPASVHQTLQSPGQPLDLDSRASMEMRLGHDFSQVRVHTDSQAALSARSVNALAYTVGQHIAFDTGQYRPDTPAGRRLMAHELVHVIQQSASQPAAGGELHIAGNDAAEHEAERTGASIEDPTRQVFGNAQTAPMLQRQPKVPAYVVSDPFTDRMCAIYGICPQRPQPSPIPGCGAYTHEGLMTEMAREYVRSQIDSSISTGVASIDCFSTVGPCTILFDSGVAVQTGLLINPFVPAGAVGSGMITIEEVFPAIMTTSQRLKTLAKRRLGPKCFYDVGCPQPGGTLAWTLTKCNQSGPSGPGDFPTPSGNERVA